jgi:ElaB/YqjD/DUF883 family membrane-anchored ribosome-binding protein
LFDSDVKHGHFIEITISEAKKHRTGFTHESVLGGKQLARVRMSFAQFAQFITTQNVGSGTPCTIAHIIGDENEPYATQWGGRPDPPDPKPFLDKFHGVGKERADRILATVSDALKQAESLLSGDDKPTKANLKNITAKLSSVHQDVKSNLPYLMECLDEEMEHKLSNAVTEFESYVASSLQEKGLEILRENTMKLNVGAIKAIGTGEEK